MKRLKAFYKTTWAECGENPGETVGGETDRGAVILLTTAVEDMLTRRIKAEMVSLTADQNARLFGPDAPLGTFSAKTRLAFALGLIDRDVSRMCDFVREMRNACAHSGRALSFANNELTDVMAAAFSFVSDEFKPSPAYKELPLLGKIHFIWLVGWLMHAIRTGSKDGATEQVNQLIANANADVSAALKRQRALKKKRPEQSAPKNPSRRKG